MTITEKIVEADGSIGVQFIVANFPVNEITNGGNIFDGLLEDLGVKMS
jgi:hypothetical protein